MATSVSSISCFSWEKGDFNEFPENAVLGGFDENAGACIFVGRV